MKKLIFPLLLMLVGFSMNAQKFSASGFLGYNIPAGGGLGEGMDQIDVDGGLTYGVDAFYYLDEDEPKLGVGVFYLASILAGVGDDVEAYGLTTFGLKGIYHMKTEGFSPFAGLGLGLSKLETPTTTITTSTGTETFGGHSATGFAIVPQVGIAFGSFQIAFDYIVPTKKKIDEIDYEGSVGSMIISLGYSQRF